MSNYELQCAIIMRDASISEEKLNELIDEQIEELSGLINGDGAIIIVAKNLGVDAFQKAQSYEKVVKYIKEQQTEEQGVSHAQLQNKFPTLKDKHIQFMLDEALIQLHKSGYSVL